MKRQVYFVACLSLVTTACGEEVAEGEPISSEQIINEVTDGLLRPESDIKIKFVGTEARPEQLEIPLRKQVFEVTPKVEGLAVWVDGETLAFRPNEPLKPGETYQVTVDLAKVLPDRPGAQPYTFKVSVPARELVKITGDFVAVGDDPGKTELRGTVVLNQPVETAKVRKAVTIKDDDRTHKVAWSSEGSTYHYVVTGLSRGANTRRFFLHVDRDPLAIVADRDESFDLPKLDEFSVVSISLAQEGDKYLVRVNMSDPIAAQQDLRGFVTVEPDVGMKASYVGKRITLSGSFERGKTYTVRVKPGIKSKWTSVTKGEKTETISIYDLPPRLTYSQTGVYLPSSANYKLAFRSVNVTRAHVTVHQVFENNLGQFLQGHTLKQHQAYYSVQPVGIQLLQETIAIESPKNELVQSELDLESALTGKKGLFVVQMSFGRADVPFKCQDNNDREEGRVAHTGSTDWGDWYWDGPDDYYKNPCRHGYWYNNGAVRRALMVTDIGLTVKKARDHVWVVATDIRSAAPIKGAKVRGFTYQQQVFDEAVTDRDGVAKLELDPELEAQQSFFYVDATWSGQRSALKIADSTLDVSTFDVGGMHDTNAGVRAFFYTERGVYRPGDTIHLTSILRNDDHTFPKNHPLELRLFNPRGTKDRSITQKTATDGVYVFEIDTKTSDYTGTWSARFFLGEDSLGSTALKVETVVPPRLKVRLEPKGEIVGPGDEKASVELSSIYLFGAPAKGLRAEVTASLFHRPRTFKKFPEFIFNAQATRFKTITTNVFSGSLDDDGKAQVEWSLPGLQGAPSDFSVSFSAKVFEKGGRFAVNSASQPVQPWSRYVGARYPYGNIRINQKSQLEVILVDPDGKPVTGQPLEVKIFTNRHRWWWQYGYRGAYRSRYKSDKETLLLHEETVTSADKPVKVTFIPKEYGELLFEIRDGSSGHMASSFVWTYGWRRPQQEKNATTLTVNAGEPSYRPGSKAKIQFSTPPGGRALVTLEQNGRIFSHRWVDVKTEQTTVEIPITEEHAPNVYAFVSYVQPHAHTKNDRPIRMYGVTPIMVESPDRKLALEIDVAKELRPQKPFTVTVRSKDKRKSQITVAVVDEGLLDLTRFATPNPEAYFYAKRPLGVSTSDMFDDVIGAIWGDIYRRFAIGGSDNEDRKQLNPIEAKRFDLVSMFRGPIDVPAGGEVKLKFEMPNYNGSVRVMVIGTHRNAYASLEETRPVRAPIILLPTLPRVAGPTDEFDLPVTVFGLKKDLGKTEIRLAVKGPLEIVGDATRELTFTEIGEQDVRFQLRGAKAVGAAKISVVAQAKGYRASYETELAVRPSSPSIAKHVDKVIDPKKTWSYKIEQQGLKGTQKALLVLSNVPQINFPHRYSWLIRYPYGCVEQTTSAAFPQLYVKELFPTLFRLQDVDRNINAAISKLVGFQKSDGSFRYWPHWRSKWHDWSNSYVGHFLGAAKRKGYYVPPEMLRKWLRFQKRHLSRSHSDIHQAYRIYTMALAGEAPHGAMNVMRENNFAGLSNPSRMLLAGAYHLAGSSDVARQIIAKVDETVADEQFFEATYGSIIRDEALALQILHQLGERERAWKVYERISQKLSGWRWYSTQGLAWALIAAGQFVSDVGLERVTVKIKVDIPGQKPVTINTRDYVTHVDLSGAVGKTAKITSSSVKPIYASVVHDFVPVEPPKEKVSENIGLFVDYYDDDGAKIDPSELRQGTSFWAVYRVVAENNLSINEVALTQVLPAGWEIENARMTGQSRPQWMQNWRYWDMAEYTDIRDDRIMWFFDLRPVRRYRYGPHGMTFSVKLNAVATGKFVQAPAFAEAMYNADYRARLEPRTVEVTK